MKRKTLSFTRIDQFRGAGIFSIEDARRKGVPRSTLLRFVRKEAVLRVGPGLYLHAKAKRISPSELDFAVACRRFGPHAVIGLLSALTYYGLTDEVARQVWVMVPHSERVRDPMYRCVRTKLSWEASVVTKKGFRISTVERALLEALKYKSKIGAVTAAKALRTALAEKLTDVSKLHAAALELKLTKVLERHWETLVV